MVERFNFKFKKPDQIPPRGQVMDTGGILHECFVESTAMFMVPDYLRTLMIIVGVSPHRWAYACMTWADRLFRGIKTADSVGFSVKYSTAEWCRMHPATQHEHHLPL